MELIKEEDVKEIVKKHVELESMLVAAPISIALLSNLCLIATSTTDFKLKGPKQGYQLLKFDSFRACLHNVVLKGYNSFDLADKSVTQIETHSKGIPGTVKEILSLVFTGEPEDIEDALPGQLKEVKEKASACNALAQKVDEEFGSVIALINELSEACTYTRAAVEAAANAKVGNEEELPALKSGQEVIADSSKSDTEKAAVSNLIENFHAMNILGVDLPTIHDALLRGLKALSNVREQWSTLARFFSNLALIVGENMQSLDKFAAAADKASKSATISTWAKKNLLAQLSNVSKTAFQVNMITSTYLEVSKAHLLGPLVSLDKLLALDKDKDRKDIEDTHHDIKEKCERSQKEIKEKATRDRDPMETNFVKHMQAILSSSNQNEQAKIQAPVEMPQMVNKGGVSS